MRSRFPALPTPTTPTTTTTHHHTHLCPQAVALQDEFKLAGIVCAAPALVPIDPAGLRLSHAAIQLVLRVAAVFPQVRERAGPAARG